MNTANHSRFWGKFNRIDLASWPKPFNRHFIWRAIVKKIYYIFYILYNYSYIICQYCYFIHPTFVQGKREKKRAGEEKRNEQEKEGKGESGKKRNIFYVRAFKKRIVALYVAFPKPSVTT